MIRLRVVALTKPTARASVLGDNDQTFGIIAPAAVLNIHGPPPDTSPSKRKKRKRNKKKNKQAIAVGNLESSAEQEES